MSRFAHESVLILNPVVLDAEFYSLSDGIIFNGDHCTKPSPFWQIINFAPCKNFRKRKILFGSAHKSVLIISPVLLNEEFNSLSDGIIFKGGIEQKPMVPAKIPLKLGLFQSILVQIRPWICADSKSGCARCRI